ncbi:hypothetical protein L1887_32515 [Cichorium endivia]|nr:hypothetical protein L1887_32515 [Cichorium endivia]
MEGGEPVYHIKRQANEESQDEPPKRVAMGNILPLMNMNIRSHYSKPGKLGPRRRVEVFYTKNNEKYANRVACLCWSLIQHVTTEHHATAFYASALGAYASELLTRIIQTLEEANVKVSQVEVPTEAESLGYNTKLANLYTYKESIVNIGISLMLPFINLDDGTYNEFIRSRKEELGGRIGMSEDEIAKHKFPFDLAHAKLVQGMLIGDLGVKEEILSYVTWAYGQHGILKSMAKYVGSILIKYVHNGIN